MRGDALSQADASALVPLVQLQLLNVSDNQLTTLAFTQDMTALEQLFANENDITDASQVSSLTSLSALNLNGNQLANLNALVAATNLGSGDTVFVTTNPFNCTAQAANIATLEDRGVSVSSDCP